MSIAQMRAHLMELYPWSPAWRAKVEGMSDRQVLALYFKVIGR